MLFRRAAVRAFSTASRTNSLISRHSYLPNSLFSSPKITLPTFAAQRRLPSLLQLRGYASEEGKEKEEEEEIEEHEPDTAEGGHSHQAEINRFAAEVRESAAAEVSEGTSEIINAKPHPLDSGRFDDRVVPSRNPNVTPRFLYVGNLFFEVTPAQLKKAFEAFGEVEAVQVIYDSRGLSKGFGYVTLKNDEDAISARNQLHGTVFEGRRMMVQQANRAGPNVPTDPNRPPTNPPSKTIFVGNMSYEMTDADLNNLFKKIKNVLDVRVAIDRRTGQPRGFAHADFMDVESAQKAMEYLRSQEFYGRKLRLDYAANPNNQSRMSRQ